MRHCGDRLSDAWEVDHMITWSRYPDDGLDNVKRHPRANTRAFGVAWRETLGRAQ